MTEDKSNTLNLLKISRLVSVNLIEIADKELGREVSDIECVIIASLVNDAFRFASYKAFDRDMIAKKMSGFDFEDLR